MTTTVSQEAREVAALTWLEKQIAYLTGLLAKADTETQHFEKLVEEGQECWASNVRLWRKYADDHRDKLSIYTTIRDTFVDRDEWRAQHENLLSIRQSELARHRQSGERGEVERYRHKKRGTVYEVIGEAELQCATHDPSEGDELVIYRGDDGKLWARMRDEFHDGRFEPITALDAHRGKQACLKARENSDG